MFVLKTKRYPDMMQTQVARFCFKVFASPNLSIRVSVLLHAQMHLHREFYLNEHNRYPQMTT